MYLLMHLILNFNLFYWEDLKTPILSTPEILQHQIATLAILHSN